jgi:hypothetical protein
MTHAGLACLLAGMLLLTAWTGSARFIDADARRDAPFAAYGILPLRVPVYETGDVWARTMVRIEEARHAAALIGDAAHFTRQDNIEETWRIMQPLLDAPPSVHSYEPGTWGPDEASQLVARHGGWHDPWTADS